MRILAIGDFHGEFPRKFEKLIRKEKIDLVVSSGDYFPFHYRKLWFRHCYGKDTQLWEVIGKKKYKRLVVKDIEDGEKALKKLDRLLIPVFTVYGNVDYTRTNDVYDMKKPKGKKYWAWDWQDFFSRIIRKYRNIKRFDYSYIRFGDYIFIGASGHSFPGHVKSRAYKKHRKILDKLFKKFSKENKKGKVIFVSHNVPYNTKIDKVGDKAYDKVRGEHYGSKLVRRIIDRYQPILHIGGHIHEAKGKAKLGRTIAVNPGAAHEGNAAIVTLPNDKNKKIKIRFINP